MDYSTFGTPTDDEDPSETQLKEGEHDELIHSRPPGQATEFNKDTPSTRHHDTTSSQISGGHRHSPLPEYRDLDDSVGYESGETRESYRTLIGSLESYTQGTDGQLYRSSSFHSLPDEIDTHSEIYQPQYNGRYERSPQKAVRNEYRAYPVRWYILFLFSLLAFNQSLGWNTWGPIAASAKVAYGWGNWTIALMAAWGPVMFIITVFFFSWMVETKGLRVGCLTAVFFITLGAAFRCVTTKSTYVTWLMSAGQICVSIAGPIAMAISSVISATWFPAGQRTTATAIANRMMALGAGFPFIVGPLLVTDVTNDTNRTTENSTALITTLRGEIQDLMYIELGMAGLIFLAMLVYFPDKPPTPPSLSVAKRKVNFQQGLRLLIRQSGFWLLGLPYSATYGIYIGWIATLDVNLQPLGVDQKTAGWIGFVGSLVSVVVGIGTGRLVDVLKGRTKPILLLLFTVAAACFIWISLLCFKIIPFNIASLYISRTIGGTALSTMPPLVFETLCESTYPVPEAVTNGLLTLLKNFWCLVFLAVLWIPHSGTLWMNWLLAGACCLCLPLVAMYKEVHGRLDIDLGHKPLDQDGQIQTGPEHSHSEASETGYIPVHEDETTPLLGSR